MNATRTNRTVCIIQGHPHSGRHLCAGLADTYAEGARKGGLKLARIDIAKLDFGFLENPADFAKPPDDAIAEAQENVRSADHLFVIYPLWLGSMPGRTKAFFEQLSRNEFALSTSDKGWPRKNLTGKSARIVVTMGMPAAAYRILLGAHGTKSFESGILTMSGVKPVRTTLIGGAGSVSKDRFDKLAARFRDMGARAS